MHLNHYFNRKNKRIEKMEYGRKMMKLTKFLTIQDVKEEFKKIPMQSFDIKKEILAQPLTKNYGRVGTAFD